MNFFSFVYISVRSCICFLLLWAGIASAQECNWYGNYHALCTETSAGWGWEDNHSCIATSTCSALPSPYGIVGDVSSSSSGQSSSSVSDAAYLCNWYGTLHKVCENSTTGWGFENNQSCISTETCENQLSPYGLVAGDQSSSKSSLSSATSSSQLSSVSSASSINSSQTSDSSSESSSSDSSDSSQASAPSGMLRLRYHVASAKTSGLQIVPLISIYNGGTSAVDISTLKIRYWYTTEGGAQEQSYWCDYWKLGSAGKDGCSYVVANFITMKEPAPTADTYLELSFSSEIGSLAPGESSNDIQSRIAKSDWSNFTQSNDYSFDETKTLINDWDHITLYQNDTLVWGIEPSSVVDEEAPSAPTDLTASNITYNSVALTWAASTDNIAVAAYDIYNGGSTPISSVSGYTTHYVVYGLSPETSYNFTVTARDASENVSKRSNEVSVITLSGGLGSYKIDPPSSCYNQFWVEGCEDGACGGQCQVANACSPPEDKQKADLPMTFACPRFMMFSDEMNQAAKDDWGDSSPFVYGVVGHDSDDGGLDEGSSSCCQCYQLIFETPEPGSAQPPALPYPKPMIVQSFNTAAGGGKNFDIYMGAGGFGAFNACVDGDYDGSQTTTFGHFMYDFFPTEYPTNGGIKAINIPECKDNSLVTPESLQSTLCQSEITNLCSNTESPSLTMTAETMASCIQTNSVDGFYHQNWHVRAKRIECPLSITRVTGCRLADQGLPEADPSATTPNNTDSSFLTGYTTTTMQDCCKPSCAWQDHVGGAGLRTVEKWSSFYSCTEEGEPITTAQ